MVVHAREAGPRRIAFLQFTGGTTVAALPLYHVFAPTVCARLAIRTGGQAVLIPSPRDMAGMIKALRGYRITMFPTVNTLYNTMLEHSDFGKLDFSQLFAVVGRETVVRKDWCGGHRGLWAHGDFGVRDVQLARVHGV